MTQDQANAKLNQFIKQYAGSRPGYPGTSYRGECLSLVKRWVDTLAGKTVAPSSGNNKGSGYYTNFPSPLSSYFTKEKFVPGRAYPRGSLVVYEATSHIGIFLYPTNGSVTTLFEQNADPDGSPAGTHQRANSRINGVLVLKVSAPAPAPAPSPSPSGKRLYFDPIGQTATFYPTKGGTFAMKIKDSSYNWNVLKNEGNRVLVNSASAGGDCWVYLKYSNTGNTIPGRYIK